MRKLSIDELKNKNLEVVWVETIGFVDEYSGYGIVGNRAAITQDFCNIVLWYEEYELTWIAYECKVMK